MEYTFEDKEILVTGGAGFIGSHVVDRLLENNANVTVVDSYITGKRENVEHHIENERFRLIEADVAFDTAKFLDRTYTHIFHLASPASPKDFTSIPQETYIPNSFGTHALLEYVSKHDTKFLFASTSEAYGDPAEHPQKEEYWGNVNPIGVRAPYDVSKRFGEMVTMTFVRHFKSDARIVRIFNTYGPRMNVDDGRAIPTFIHQALTGVPITVHGDGNQTRSFSYVSDLVEFIFRAMMAEKTSGEVINIGNPDEYTVNQVVAKIKQLTGSKSEIEYIERPQDDPNKRKPDITKAKALLAYAPEVMFDQGLITTIDYYKKRLQKG